MTDNPENYVVQLRSAVAEVTRGFSDLRAQVAGFAGEISGLKHSQTTLSWGAGLVAVVITAVLGGAIAIQAGRIDTLDTRLAGFQTEVLTSIGDIKESVARIEGKLEKLDGIQAKLDEIAFAVPSDETGPGVFPLTAQSGANFPWVAVKSEKQMDIFAAAWESPGLRATNIPPPPVVVTGAGDEWLEVLVAYQKALANAGLSIQSGTLDDFFQQFIGVVPVDPLQEQ